jgi:laminin G domain protein
MHTVVRAALVVGLVLPALAGGLSATATATTPVATWQLDEAPGATVMTDSSGNNIDGAISGDAASQGLTTGGGSYHWTVISPTAPPAKPARVVTVNDPGLNPGTRDWAISFRYRTTKPYGNIMQKGQATTGGGQIKFQLPKGQISCLFRGQTAKRSIKTVKAYNDNAWHTVRCARTATKLTLTVDGGATAGGETRSIAGASGNLSNSSPFVIGGKTNCDQVTVTCDYFTGDIDWITVEAF